MYKFAKKCDTKSDDWIIVNGIRINVEYIKEAVVKKKPQVMYGTNITKITFNTIEGKHVV